MSATVHPTLPALALALGLAAGAATAQDPGSYSYFRLVEGSATLIQQGTGTRSQAEINFPILVGDQLWVAPDSRLEVVLSDFNRLRLDGDTEVVFESLAHSPDAADTSTGLRLVAGRLQLVVVDDAGGDELPRIVTNNATVYIQTPGSYIVSASRDDWTHVLVRSGFAEIASESGSTVVRSDEEASIEGQRWSTVHLQAASFEDEFERWGRLEDERLASAPELPDVDEPLRYSSGSLDDHGEWVEVDERRAWRPYAESGWRPYWRGRWVYTPSGLTWVSYEPWGWVPYHYGTWDLHHRHGWLWYPGSVFAPAHVYWYWGPSYAAWIPIGYYTRFYRPFYHGYGFRFGVYGYAGGSFDYFRDWIFCPPRYFGRHRQSHHHHHGSGMGEVLRTAEVPRGIITTDTRRLTPERWRQPERAQEILRGEVARRDGQRDDLPDVTPFLHREPGLRPELQDWLLERQDRPRSPAAVTRTARGGDDPPPTRTLGRSPASPTAGTVPRTPTSSEPGRRPGSGRDGTLEPGRVGRSGAPTAGTSGRSADESPRAIEDVLHGGPPSRQAGPRQAEPRQAGPRQAGPRQAEPRQAGPRQAEPRQAGPRRPSDDGRSLQPRSGGPLQAPRGTPSPTRRPGDDPPRTERTPGQRPTAVTPRSPATPSPSRPRERPTREVERPGHSPRPDAREPRVGETPTPSSRGVTRRVLDGIRNRSDGRRKAPEAAPSPRYRPAPRSTTPSRVSPRPPSSRTPATRAPSTSRTRQPSHRPSRESARPGRQPSTRRPSTGSSSRTPRVSRPSSSTPSRGSVSRPSRDGSSRSSQPRAKSSSRSSGGSRQSSSRGTRPKSKDP